MSQQRALEQIRRVLERMAGSTADGDPITAFSDTLNQTVNDILTELQGGGGGLGSSSVSDIQAMAPTVSEISDQITGITGMPAASVSDLQAIAPTASEISNQITGIVGMPAASVSEHFMAAHMHYWNIDGFYPIVYRVPGLDGGWPGKPNPSVANHDVGWTRLFVPPVTASGVTVWVMNFNYQNSSGLPPTTNADWGFPLAPGQTLDMGRIANGVLGLALADSSLSGAPVYLVQHFSTNRFDIANDNPPGTTI
jgi:hypothetical protein